jgi:hypothetical protein
MRRFLRENGLSVFFGVLTLVTIGAQSVAGQHTFNEQALEHGSATYSWGRYVLSSEFGAALLENWQSEFLQFSFFIAATIWLVQRGSNESKAPDDVGLESPQKQRLLGYAPKNAPGWARVGGIRTSIYSHSLLIAMTAIFLATWAGQSLTARNEYNNEQRDHDEPAVGWATYLARADFWERSLQNWQSEFLAVGTMAIFTVYLRQRGSPESKPVGAPHDETGTSG